MKTYALTLNLKDDDQVVEEYKRYHQAVWPEVTARLREVGITGMQIFLVGRRLFMYMTAVNDFDPTVDFPRYSEQPRAREWDDLMRGFQEKAPEAKEGEWWALMEEVFDLRWPQHQ